MHLTLPFLRYFLTSYLESHDPKFKCSFLDQRKSISSIIQHKYSWVREFSKYGMCSSSSTDINFKEAAMNFSLLVLLYLVSGRSSRATPFVFILLHQSGFIATVAKGTYTNLCQFITPPDILSVNFFFTQKIILSKKRTFQSSQFLL